MTNEEFSKTALTAVVAAFEERLAEGEPVDWRSFLPSWTHPNFRNFALEMILVDIHHQWRQGVRRSVADYLSELPSAFQEDASFLKPVAIEEWRCRCKTGEAADLGPILAQYGLPDDGERPLEQPEPRPHQLSKRLSDELDSLLAKSPEPFGFRVVEPLGDGQLSRVFLGEQPQVGRRKIVVKVGIGPAQEVEALGRLHHENIVPLYWAECDPPYYVLCMPFFGRATLQRFLREVNGRRDKDASLLWNHLGGRVGYRPALRSDATFEEGSLWLASRIARGLSHAHSQGVIHGDVKPANILLATNGEPLLLDFNLAALGDRLPLGGTFHYMSPEQLRAMKDGRADIQAPSDIFNLGVVLFELLCGRRPFPDRPQRAGPSLEQLLEDRRRAPDWNGTRVSPSVRAIVETCLAYQPKDRYCSCAELFDDLDSHLHDKPLRRAPNPSYRELGRKQASRTVAWFTKPRPLKIMLAVAALALVGSSLFAHHLLASSAASKRAAIHTKLDDLCFDFSLLPGRFDRVLAGLRSFEKLDLEQPMGDGWTDRGLLLWVGSTTEERRALADAADQVKALAASAISAFRENPDLVASQHRLKSPDAELVKRSLHLLPLVDPVETEKQLSPAGQQLVHAVRLYSVGQYVRAKKLLVEAIRRNPDDFWVRYWDFKCDEARGLAQRALVVLEPCRAIRPNRREITLLRARAELVAGYPEDAERTADELISESFELGEAHRIRGWALAMQRGRAAEALTSFELAAVNGADGPALRLMAAAAARLANDPERLREELSKVEDLTPRTVHDWIALISVRLQNGGENQRGVDEALNRALELDPSNPQALAFRGLLLLVRDRRPYEAAEALGKHCKPELDLPNLQALHGEALLELREIDKSADAALAIMNSETRNPALWLRAASLLSRCCAAVDDPGKKPDWEDESLRALRRVQKANSLSEDDLRKDDFKSLANHPGFRALVPNPKAPPLGTRPQLRSSNDETMKIAIPESR